LSTLATPTVIGLLLACLLGVDLLVALDQGPEGGRLRLLLRIVDEGELHVLAHQVDPAVLLGVIGVGGVVARRSDGAGAHR
jgi:hypothetical protein